MDISSLKNISISPEKIKGICPRFVNRGKPKTKERCHKEIYKYGVCKYHYFKNRGFTGK